MQDCYEILKVNKGEIVRLGKDEAKINAYIKRCYDETVRIEVELPKQVAMDTITDKLELIKELELLEQVQKLCDEAYKMIATAEDREKYAETAEINERIRFERMKNATTQEKFNQLKKQYSQLELEAETQREEQIDKYAKFREKYQHREKRTPYNVLNIQEERFQEFSCRVRLAMLNNKKEELLKNYSSILTQSQDFIERAEISIKMNEVAEAYLELKRQVEEKRYDHTSEYQPDLIKGMIENNDSIENKIVIRQKNKDTGNEKPINENMDSGERYITDQKRRNLRVKNIAQIGYQNIKNEKVRCLYEYQLTRRINGEDKSDIVTSPVSVADILLDKRIGKEGAIDVYNFLANELFSEETIKGAQKNEGFIGSIKQDKEGNYYLTLDENQLDPEEQEMLAATMICREKERQKSEEGR